MSRILRHRALVAGALVLAAAVVHGGTVTTSSRPVSSGLVPASAGAAGAHAGIVAPAHSQRASAAVAHAAPATIATPPPASTPASTSSPSSPAAGRAVSAPLAAVPPPLAPTQFMSVCGVQFCIGGAVFHPFGATFYQSSPQSGIDNPAGAVQLAQLEHLNTMRVVNFYNPTHDDPANTPFSDAVWSKVDTLIADAQAAGIRVVLDLADYRNILMDHCINPYTYDWTAFETYVAHRVNHVTGSTYAADPEIAMVSFSGEPLPVGTHGCISYTTADLTNYFHAVTRTWKSLDGAHVVTSGGLGYLNFNSGIDWQAIDSDPNSDVCGFKTYGGMMAWLPTGASYCNNTLGKPWFNDEWGYQQSGGDATVATEFAAQFENNSANHAAASFFWNAGYQSTATTYDVGPEMPLTMAVVIAYSFPFADSLVAVPACPGVAPALPGGMAAGSPPRHCAGAGYQ